MSQHGACTQRGSLDMNSWVWSLLLDHSGRLITNIRNPLFPQNQRSEGGLQRSGGLPGSLVPSSHLRSHQERPCGPSVAS